MLNSFNFAIEHGVFHRDQKTSLISLLLKKGKDPLDCSSYRPISLIPCDLKIYAKVFASRMEKVIHSLIKEDQTGFIKGRNASDNMRRLLHILDFADSHPSPCAFFSLDAEKAFDRLVWHYMWAVLQCFGFGEHFIYMIKTLYHSPATSVITGNIISPPFPLQRGTRQGCPLSPLLFCLSLFFVINTFHFSTHNTTQHPKYNKTKQQTHTQHLKVQSKGRERWKDNKNTKVTPLYNRVYQTKNTAKHQWSKAWPHRLAPLHIRKSLFAGGYGSNMFFHTCVV